MMKIIASILLLFLTIQSFAQNSVSLLFIGDVMGHDAQLESAFNEVNNTYEFDSCFTYISPILKAHDFTIANLEVTLNCRPFTGYPAFSSPPALAESLVKSGVNCFVTANNHSADRGKKGVTQTIKTLDSIGVKHTGTFASKQEFAKNNPLILEKNGIRIALLNYTYGLNGIPVPEGTIINLIDTVQITKDIQKAKTLKVDQTIVFIHWGVEYELSPNIQQIQIAQSISNAGANIIIGSHPHVVQRAEFNETTQKFVVYSLGNFVSNQRPQPRDGGAMIELKLEKTKTKTHIVKAGYILTWVYIRTIGTSKKYFVLPVSKFEDKPDFFDSQESFNTMKACVAIMRDILVKQNKNTLEITFPK